MTLSSPGNKADKRVVALVTEMARALGRDVDTLWEWIRWELEGISIDQIELPRQLLSKLEARFKLLNSELRELQLTATAREALNARLSEQIATATLELTAREQQLIESRAKLGRLQQQLAALDRQLNVSDGEQKQVGYQLIMRPHAKEHRPKSMRFALIAFTLLGILIAVWLILRKAGRIP